MLHAPQAEAAAAITAIGNIHIDASFALRLFL